MSTPAASNGWGWLDASTDDRPPAPVVALPPRRRPARTVVVVGAAGGAGTSVLSVLAADARAAAGQHAVWIDRSATGDAANRITTPSGSDAADALVRSVSGAQLLTGERGSLSEVVETAPAGASVVLDAGVLDDPARWPGEVSVLLVIAARPDTANRSKAALAALDVAGLLEHATVVVSCLDPWAAHLVGHRLTEALSRRAGRVLLWDYDPHLGSGGPIDPAQLASSTTLLLSRLEQPHLDGDAGSVAGEQS
ncbi:hypothetical protein DFR67_12650 [Williamsia limnetica]|uniref:MinD-like ATPase involved in chromosome partitioning or flagellar assembly n=1 Tax=Williamsia limnetica TaxID=882452 RepID=A0A318RAP3_WILLI|nr:hypothetical protein [Williamsia limnetica]PYE12042.1 hypothetical protein DFR67_12650 [Williamsia limnetica]